MRKIILIHVVLLLVCLTMLLLFAEKILDIFMPSFHQVEMWMWLMVFGAAAIFTTLCISCAIFIAIRKTSSK